MSATKLSLFFVRETDLARQYSRVNLSRFPLDVEIPEHDLIWVPKSIIEHTTKYPDGLHIVTLPDWFLEKEGL